MAIVPGQHPDGPVFSAARAREDESRQDNPSRSRPRERTGLELRRRVVSVRGKTVRDLYQVETGPPFQQLGVIHVRSGRTEIRDQALKKSNELQIREWEQVPLNKRDHDLQPRIGNVEQVECLDPRSSAVWAKFLVYRAFT